MISRSEEAIMISQPSLAWRMLSRMVDRLLTELTEDDLSDLHEKVQRERNRRFLASRHRPSEVNHP